MYWIINGSFNPISSLSFSIFSGVARLPNRSSAGSPGAIFPMKNTKKEAIKSSTGVQSSLLLRYSIIETVYFVFNKFLYLPKHIGILVRSLKKRCIHPPKALLGPWILHPTKVETRRLRSQLFAQPYYIAGLFL